MPLQQVFNPLLSNWPSFAMLLGFYVLFKFLGSASKAHLAALETRLAR